MGRVVILNVFEDCKEERFVSDVCIVYNVPRQRAEVARNWACGIEISQLNIYCELSPDATLYLFQRCRGRVEPQVQYTLGQGAYSKYAGLLSLCMDIREWANNAYE